MELDPFEHQYLREFQTQLTWRLAGHRDSLGRMTRDPQRTVSIPVSEWEIRVLRDTIDKVLNS